MILVPLRGVIRIIPDAEQRILGGGRAKPSLRARKNGNANTERSEIDTRDNGHVQLFYG